MKKKQKVITVKNYALGENGKKRFWNPKDIRTVVFACFILLMVAGAVIAVPHIFAKTDAGEQAETASGTQAEPTASPAAAPTETQVAGCPDYLKPFLEANFNTVGYIKIDDTEIDYPVLQTSNNDYYMTHNFNGEEDRAGAIFMDFRCDINDFSKTRNIILYGHRMRDGSQFKGLVQYEDAEFFRNHQTIRFDTINGPLTWEVFAVFETTTDDYYIETEFPYDDMWVTFLESYYEKSMVHVFTNFHPNDIVLTLSTCGVKEDQRVVVMAKLVQ